MNFTMNWRDYYGNWRDYHNNWHDYCGNWHDSVTYNRYLTEGDFKKPYVTT